MSRYTVEDAFSDEILEKARSASSIKVASPYVTAAEVFFEGSSADRVLYTSISAINFVSGASSLNVLKALILDGVLVFHVDCLHAKVALIGEGHCSIGSQNLTIGGKLNLEANVVTDAAYALQEVEGFFQRVEVKGKLVTLKDLEEIERAVKALIAEFGKIRESAHEIDDRIQKKLPVRSAVTQTQLEGADHMRRLRKRLESSLNEAQEVGEAVSVKIKKFYNSTSYYGMRFTEPTHSLVPLGDFRFTDLLVEGGMWGRRFYRYLIIDEKNGMMAFARVARGRISYFNDNVIPGEALELRGRRYIVKISFERDQEKLKFRNGFAAISLFSDGSQIGSVDFVFSLRGVKLVGLSEGDLDGFSGRVSRVNEKLLLGTSLRNYIQEHILEEFRYKSGNLSGLSASSFFQAPVGTRFLLKAEPVGTSGVLIARQI